MTSAHGSSIRPIALAVVRRSNDLLVFEGRDELTAETFYRPLGGGIEFGESAVQAVQRELREELAVELENLELLGVLENIFQSSGQAGHEIVFVFSADLADHSLYAQDDLGQIMDTAEPVSWQALDRFAAGEAPLYPIGLLALLREARGASAASPAVAS